MTQSAALVEALKRELKSRGVTYASLAPPLKLSEASVKRMFSRRDFTLKRLDDVCAFAGIDFSELARGLPREQTLLSRLTLDQEKEIVADPKLLLIAVCALNQVAYDQIVDLYDISPAEGVRLLTKLDRLKFIELQPGNRMKLLVSRTFAWLPEGPIQTFFRDHAAEFFRSDFKRDDEFVLVVNGMLSKASRAAMLDRVKRIAREFSDLHSDDSRLPLGDRKPITLCVALRHWELEAFAKLRRKRDAARKVTPGR